MIFFCVCGLFVSLWLSLTGAAQHSYTVFNKKTHFFMKLLLQICQEKKGKKRKKKGGADETRTS